MLRPIKISHYVSFMKSIGYDEKLVLEGSGIRAEQLVDPDYLLDRQQCEAVVSNMIRITGNQAIGFDIAAQAEPDDFGIIGYAMRSSRTLRDAISYWIHYSNLVGMMVRLTLLEEPNGGWTVIFTATEPSGFIFNFCIEEILVIGARVGSSLVQMPLQISEIRLSYPAPLHLERYREHFQCPVRFNAERCSITVSAPSLDAPLAGYNAELNEIYRRRCREVLRQIGGDDPVPAKLRALLLSAEGALPDQARAAQKLGMSERTLRRRLSQEGLTYQSLIHQHRRDLCIEYVSRGVLSNKEIAAQLGFKDTNSLHRAFRKWTGSTLGSVRTGESSKDVPTRTASASGQPEPRVPGESDAVAELLRTGFLIHDVSRLRHRLLDRHVKTLAGITRHQWWLLIRLGRPGLEPLTQGEIGRLVDMEKAPLGRLIGRLEKHGLISRLADPDDRRLKRIQVTPQGHQLIMQMRTVAIRLSQQSMRGISYSHQQELNRRLREMKQNLLRLNQEPTA